MVYALRRILLQIAALKLLSLLEALARAVSFLMELLAFTSGVDPTLPRGLSRVGTLGLVSLLLIVLTQHFQSKASWFRR